MSAALGPGVLTMTLPTTGGRRRGLAFSIEAMISVTIALLVVTAMSVAYISAHAKYASMVEQTITSDIIETIVRALVYSPGGAIVSPELVGLPRGSFGIIEESGENILYPSWQEIGRDAELIGLGVYDTNQLSPRPLVLHARKLENLKRAVDTIHMRFLSTDDTLEVTVEDLDSGKRYSYGTPATGAKTMLFVRRHLVLILYPGTDYYGAELHRGVITIRLGLGLRR